MSDETIYFMPGKIGFFSSLYPEAAEANGVKYEDMTVISSENYASYINPPEGKYLFFDEKGPRLEDIPSPDYPTINAAEAQRRTDSAMNSISVLVTKLNIGRTLTTAEKAKVNAVLDYCDAISALDLSGETVDWPELQKH